MDTISEPLTSQNEAELIRSYRREKLIRAARRNFLTFATVVYPNYDIGQHHQKMGDALEKVERGEITRLIVSMPPRHGKSLTISQIFPCYFFGRNPTKDIIQAGYSDDISVFHSKHARIIFGSERYADVFPGVAKRIDEANIAKQSVHEWTTLHGGRYRASGILSGISGRGADIIIVDDPVKNRQEANSQTIRARVESEYKSTLYTRQTPTCAIIIVMTRWHPRDLVGYRIEEMKMGGEQWTILQLPAISNVDEPLWPSRWPIAKLLNIKSAIGADDFEALYQQNPQFQEGALFRKESFGDILDEWPAMVECVRVWDRASTDLTISGGKPDWTAGVKLGKDEQGMFYILDVVRMQGDPYEVQKTILETAKKDGPACSIGIFVDPGSAGKFEVAYTIRELAGYNVVEIPQTKAKEVRAKPASVQVKKGNVKICRGAWNRDFIDEIELVFTGDYDDQGDAFSGAISLLALGADALTQDNYVVGESNGPIQNRPVFTPSQSFTGTGFR